MIFRTYHEETLYVIEAPAGSKLVCDDGGAEELVVFEAMPGGMVVERRLPPTVVIKAASRGSFGLVIREARRPMHPEADFVCPT